MNLADMIEVYNIKHGNDIDDINSLYADIDIDSRLDKEILINTILDECGAMDCLYTTTEVFKRFSDNFFKKYKWNITKLLDTLELKYDPIKNKNLEWTETTSIEQNLNTEEESGETRNRANTGNQNTNYTDNEENTISAMNDNNYQPDNNRANNGNTTRTDNLNESITSDKDRNKNEALTWEETDTHKESGVNDIIVQDLIEKERKVAQFSIYAWISRKYSKELFLLIY